MRKTTKRVIFSFTYLHKYANIKLLPGFDKTDTPSGAEGRWIDGDFVRFRYAQPEKIGGFAAIGQKTIAGPARAQHTWTDLQGRKYAAIGTSKVLLIYYEDAFYDVTPLDTGLTGATFTSVNGQPTVTVNKTAHGLVSGDYFLWKSFSKFASLIPINVKIGIFRKRKGQLSENLEKYYLEMGVNYKKKRINILRLLISFFYLLTKSKL